MTGGLKFFIFCFFFYCQAAKVAVVLLLLLLLLILCNLASICPRLALCVGVTTTCVLVCVLISLISLICAFSDLLFSSLELPLISFQSQRERERVRESKSYLQQIVRKIYILELYPNDLLTF